jgi:hypothetical protein
MDGELTLFQGAVLSSPMPPHASFRGCVGTISRGPAVIELAVGNEAEPVQIHRQGLGNEVFRLGRPKPNWKLLTPDWELPALGEEFPAPGRE